MKRLIKGRNPMLDGGRGSDRMTRIFLFRAIRIALYSPRVKVLGKHARGTM